MCENEIASTPLLWYFSVSLGGVQLLIQPELSPHSLPIIIYSGHHFHHLTPLKRNTKKLSIWPMGKSMVHEHKTKCQIPEPASLQSWGSQIWFSLLAIYRFFLPLRLASSVSISSSLGLSNHVWSKDLSWIWPGIKLDSWHFVMWGSLPWNPSRAYDGVVVFIWCSYLVT